jgi:hypothetical protein
LLYGMITRCEECDHVLVSNDTSAKASHIVKIVIRW